MKTEIIINSVRFGTRKVTVELHLAWDDKTEEFKTFVVDKQEFIKNVKQCIIDELKKEKDIENDNKDVKYNKKFVAEI
jgi:hypothetical protein